jgi:hypothetical protein
VAGIVTLALILATLAWAAGGLWRPGETPQYAVGDCFTTVFDPARPITYPEGAAAPCSGVHRSEVLGTQDFEAEGGFDANTVLGEARAVCEPVYAAVDPEILAAHPDIETMTLAPNAVTWRQGDRTIVCIVQDPVAPFDAPVPRRAPSDGVPDGGGAGRV